MEKAQGKASTKRKNRWNAKNYDQLPIRIPKGKKNLIDQHAKLIGKSVNGMVNDLIRTEMGMTEAEWQRDKTDSDNSPQKPQEQPSNEDA